MVYNIIMPGGKKKTVTTSKSKPKSKVTTTKKKTFRNKKTFSKGPMKLFDSRVPYPRIWKCKFHYVDQLDLTTGESGLIGASTKYALNGLWDPNLTVSGHKPYGYNQLKVLYSKYLVRGCHVKITFTNPSADGVVVACLVQQGSGIGGISGIYADVVKEQPYSWTCPMNNTGSQVKIFSQYFPINTIEGLSNVQYECSLSQYSADTATANPSIVPFLLVGVGSDTYTQGVTVTARVELTYYSQLYEPILQAQSGH